MNEPAANRREPWSTPRAAGAVALLAVVGPYALGYLTLRFRLAALGVATDLGLWDERYYFEGLRFLADLLLTVPLIAFAALALAAVFYLPYRLLPRRVRAKVQGGTSERLGRLRSRWSTPSRLGLVGTVFAAAVVQFALRPCLTLEDLLLRPTLEAPTWLRWILLDTSGVLLPLYLAGLLLAAALSGRLLGLAWGKPLQSSRSRLLLGLLACLVAAQVGLVAVAYGVLTAGREVPRLATPGATASSPGSRELWLVWEGRESSVYLVRERRPTEAGEAGEGGGTWRSLVMRRSEAGGSTEIACHDPLLRILYAGARSPCPNP